MSQEPKYQHVLLTGATGFVGGHILDKLLEAGRTPICLTRHESPLDDDPRVRTVRGEIADAASLARAAEGAQAAIHLVGILDEHGQQTFEHVHVDGTAAVIAACRQAGVRRLVHMSALGSRADGPTRYYRSKAQAEQLVRDSGLDWTIFRPSIIHGPDGQFTQTLARLATGVMPMVALGPGDSRVSPVWVGDVAAAFVAALDRDETVGHSYDLGGPDALTWNQMFEIVAAELIGRPRPIVHLPVGLAKCMGSLFAVCPFGGPFTKEHVVMAQEDLAVEPAVVEQTFGLSLAPFAQSLHDYREQLLVRMR